MRLNLSKEQIENTILALDVSIKFFTKENKEKEDESIEEFIAIQESTRLYLKSIIEK